MQLIYQLNRETVEVVFTEDFFAPGWQLHSVALVGSFCDWKAECAWPMLLDDEGTWNLEVPRDKINVPGNSGYPEFQFLLDGKHWYDSYQTPWAPQFLGNFVLLWETDTQEELSRKEQVALTFVRESYDVEALSNFRMLQGGDLAPGRLYRSYHPFLPSRHHQHEYDRLEAVQQKMEEQGIQAVLNLTDEATIVNCKEITPFYKTLIEEGKVCFATTTYEEVYYHSSESGFIEVVHQVLEFIATHPGPYLVHCRLGTDRTGVLSALLQSLAGVDWAQIKNDYQLSNRMSVGEFRDPRLLAYTFEQFLGLKSLGQGSLKEALHDRLLKSGFGAHRLKTVLKHLTSRQEEMGF